MARTLYELVEFEKSVATVTKTQLKKLRKAAKKARKGKGELPKEVARERLDSLFDLVAAHVDTATTREHAETAAGVDLIVDGELLVPQATPRLLLRIRKSVSRLRKVARELQRVHADAEISALAARADRLCTAIDRAVEEANAIEVEEHQVSEAVLGYLRRSDGNG